MSLLSLTAKFTGLINLLGKGKNKVRCLVVQMLKGVFNLF